ncbi:hypothetical protein TNCT_90161 [Trichonephila clavata]|uniref:Uncharacterized protein n=1 Tax=Trichonephila clavata TaxID=2740835 RepID=A0A8X6GTI2_TRICU|nr:hypothetical protein TNCT_90161 [Trichonephila clavata]
MYPLAPDKNISEISKYFDVICAYFEQRYRLLSFRVDNKPGKLPFQFIGCMFQFIVSHLSMPNLVLLPILMWKAVLS